MIAVNPIAKPSLSPVAYVSQQAFEATIQSRLGVVPNAFKGDSGSFRIKQKLWEETEFSYIDNPLPSLFKERLFVYLSTFCKTRYCLVRHVGFLVGSGYPAGDPTCPSQSAEEVLALLRFSLPMDASLKPYTVFCQSHKELPLQQIASNSFAEQAIFACAAHLFLQSDQTAGCTMALKKILGVPQFEWLIVLLNFIHTTHLSASVNTDLFFEGDVISMMHAYKQIAACLLKAPEIYPAAITQQMLDDLTMLQTTARKYQAVKQDYETLVKQYNNLHKRQKDQQAAMLQVKELQQQVRLLELMHDPMIVWEMDGGIAVWNTGARKHYGYTKEEASGQVIHTLLQTKGAVPIADIISTIEKKGEWFGELEHTLKNGRVIVVESRQRMFKLAGRKCILETNHDITARKQAEEALRLSEERLQLAASAAGFGIHDTDLMDKTVYWSPELKAIHGMNADAQLTSEKATNSIHPDDQKEVLKKIIELTKPESSGELENDFRIRRADTGETRWLHSRSRIFFSEIDGKPTPTRYTGICIDITEQRRAQEQLRLSEEKYRTLFESIDEGFCIIDVLFDAAQRPVDYRFLEINPAFERHTGLTSAIGKRIRDIAPQHEDYWSNVYGQVATTGQPVRLQAKADALNRFYDVYAFKIGGPDERKVAVLFNDITQRKALEQKQAEFVSIASHELKTPVTSIKAYTEVLQDKLQDGGDVESATMVVKLNAQVDRLTNLIRALLDTTQIAEGQLRLNRQRFNLNEVITEKVEELQRLTSRHPIRWQMPVVENCIVADKEKVEQVLTNLISNAIKYSPAGGDICVACKKEADLLMVSVQDCGLGIAEDLQPQVFSRFYRADHPSANTISGLGLGLYITAGIVQQHGGSMEVKSELGKGSKFTFSLPCPA